MERLPGASRASQPECDADCQIFTRRICQVYLTVKHLVTAVHERLVRVMPPNPVRISCVRPKPADRGDSTLCHQVLASRLF